MQPRDGRAVWQTSGKQVDKRMLETARQVWTEQEEAADCTGLAETNLVRLASTRFSAELLATCTLYTSTEPCAMCAGAIYWSGIVRVVYALSEAGLRDVVAAQEGVPTMELPCREVFARGGRPVAVAGPAELPEATDVHVGYWA